MTGDSSFPLSLWIPHIIGDVMMFLASSVAAGSLYVLFSRRRDKRIHQPRQPILYGVMLLFTVHALDRLIAVFNQFSNLEVVHVLVSFSLGFVAFVCSTMIFIYVKRGGE